MLQRFFASSCVALAFLLMAQPAAAARIYNFLPLEVTVRGISDSITVQPGKRSASISWGGNHVAVFVTSRMLDTCPIVFFGLHAEMNGGHYLVISHEGTTVTCDLCDSDHHIMFTTTGRVANEVAKQFQGRSSDHGC